MTEKETLVKRIHTLANAAKTGDPDLIQYATFQVNAVLKTLPENWTKKEEEAKQAEPDTASEQAEQSSPPNNSA